MNLYNFELSIVEGREREGGYVELQHNTQYTIQLGNNTHRRCDVLISIDGGEVGTWRLNAFSTAIVQRPVHDNGRFTFYRIGSCEANSIGLSNTSETGLIRAVYMPEQETPKPKSIYDSGIRFSMKTPRAGGTGLSGQSTQKFQTVGKLTYDETAFVNINLRLVCADSEPRSLFQRLFQRSNPTPPPVW